MTIEETMLKELDAFFDEMADAENDAIEAQKRFAKAFDALQDAVDETDMTMAEYRANRRSRGLGA